MHAAPAETARRPGGWGAPYPEDTGAQASGPEGGRSTMLALMAEGRSNPAIAEALVVSEGAVEKHVGSIFATLSLLPSATDSRRVLAVLAWLRG